MNPHLLFLLVVGTVVAVIVVGAYLKFRRGLATRIFATVIPLAGFTGYLGYYAGLNGRAIDLVVVALIGAVVAVPTLFLFYRAVVVRLQTQISSLAASTSQVGATAQQAAATASEQASTVSEVGATIDEINQTSAATASMAQKVLGLATDAADKGQDGVAAVEDATRVMESIGSVAEVVELVSDLAEQSNLLAVNAGIEAAKAGEHGRGFAVVAAEVRNLAEQSKRATRQIRSAILRVEEGQRSIGTVRDVIAELQGVLEESADSARQISAAASQQAAGIQQISGAMATVAEGGRNSAEAAHQLESAVGSLRSVGDGLDRFING
jgi:methyl-accepting chemotaxis protein